MNKPVVIIPQHRWGTVIVVGTPQSFAGVSSRGPKAFDRAIAKLVRSGE